MSTAMQLEEKRGEKRSRNDEKEVLMDDEDEVSQSKRSCARPSTEPMTEEDHEKTFDDNGFNPEVYENLFSVCQSLTADAEERRLRGELEDFDKVKVPVLANTAIATLPDEYVARNSPLATLVPIYAPFSMGRIPRHRTTTKSLYQAATGKECEYGAVGEHFLMSPLIVEHNDLGCLTDSLVPGQWSTAGWDLPQLADNQRIDMIRWELQVRTSLPVDAVTCTIRMADGSTPTLLGAATDDGGISFKAELSRADLVPLKGNAEIHDRMPFVMFSLTWPFASDKNLLVDSKSVVTVTDGVRTTQAFPDPDVAAYVDKVGGSCHRTLVCTTAADHYASAKRMSNWQKKSDKYCPYPQVDAGKRLNLSTTPVTDAFGPTLEQIEREHEKMLLTLRGMAICEEGTFLLRFLNDRDKKVNRPDKNDDYMKVETWQQQLDKVDQVMCPLEEFFKERMRLMKQAFF